MSYGSSNTSGGSGDGPNLAALLKKTSHYDKDERYMATSDLCEVLKRHQQHHTAATLSSSSGGTTTATATTTATPTTTPVVLLDAATERQICTAVLRLLHDKSNDVQAIAVKTLSVLLTTVQQEQVCEIADSLADQVLDSSKSELRDVYAIGLRTLLKTIPMQYGNAVSVRLVSRLLEGCRSTSTSSGGTDATTTKDNDIALACLDALTDLVTRFGLCVSVVRQHDTIVQMCLQQLIGSDQNHNHKNAATATTTAASASSPSSSSSSNSHATATHRAVVRKRAGTTLGCLSIVLSDVLLHRLVESILQQLELLPTNSDATRALIRTLCTMAGTVGHRLGQAQIDRIVPLFLKFTLLLQQQKNDGTTHKDHDNDTMDHDGSNDDDEDVALNELRESCLLGFESFVLRCPYEQVEPHLHNIIQASLLYMGYDPNYSYDDDHDDDGEDEEQAVVPDAASADDMQEEEEEPEEEEEEYEGEEDDEEDDDDDDESWKVRRSAIRALKAVVEAHKHNPTPLWKDKYSTSKTNSKKTTTVAYALVKRFKEREENCRVGVMDCFTRLLAVTIATPLSSSVVVSLQGGASDNDVVMGSDTDVPVIPIQSYYTPKLVTACQTILATKSNERSKSAAMTLLSTVCQAPGGLGGAVPIRNVFTHIKVFLQLDPSTSGSGAGTAVASSHGLGGSGGSGSKALRLDALSLVHAVLASDKHQASDVRQNLPLLLSQLCGAVKEQWYKVIAEALRAIASVPKFYEPPPADDVAAEEEDAAAASETRQQVAEQLYDAIMPLLAAHDVDQEIKECALKACANLLSSLHSSLPHDKKVHLLKLLLERLQNETTRLSAMKTLSQIATTVDVSPTLADSIQTLAGFLKLASRSVKQSSLEALEALIVYHGKHESLQGGELYSAVLQDCAPLLVDSDLHLSHLSLRAAVSILQVCPNAGPAVKAHTLEPALNLSTSPLLQENLASDSLQAFFRQMITSDVISFDELRFLLNQRCNDKLGKHGIYNLAKCIAVVVAENKDNAQVVLDEIFVLFDGTEAAMDVDKLRRVNLALLITGDLGRMMDLSAFNGAPDRLKAIYLSYFDSPSEDLKHAAAYALGNASVGSQASFLPTIVSKLDADNKKMQYLLLSALREFIQSSFRQTGGVGITPSLPIIVPPLERHCSDEEEGVRTMVAECMGSLAALHPSTMLPKLDELKNAHSNINAPDGTIAEDDEVSKINALVCWTVATSVKQAIAGKVDSAQLSQYMPSFVKLIEQKELNVRNAALLMIYSAVHHMPQVVSPLMKDSVVPSLYEVSELKLERKVDLGPFTHRVDDALPLRKAALSIFATCLDHLPGSIDITAFMPVLAKALGDAEDIQLHAHQIIISMCTRHPTYLVASVDSFVEPLDKTLNKKPGQKTGTELERLNDWIKSALRVVLTLSKIDDVMNSRAFADFVNRIKANSKFTHTLESLSKES